MEEEEEALAEKNNCTPLGVVLGADAAQAPSWLCLWLQTTLSVTCTSTFLGSGNPALKSLLNHDAPSRTAKIISLNLTDLTHLMSPQPTRSLLEEG